MCLPRSGENDVDFVGNLETEEGELPDDLAGATGIVLTPVTSYFFVFLSLNQAPALNKAHIILPTFTQPQGLP